MNIDKLIIEANNSLNAAKEAHNKALDSIRDKLVANCRSIFNEYDFNTNFIVRYVLNDGSEYIVHYVQQCLTSIEPVKR